MDTTELVKALVSFVDAINATGGITRDHRGFAVPVADPEWIDLGSAYEEACNALGKQPLVVEPE